MQKNKNIIFLFLFYFIIFPIFSLDKVGLHCVNIKNKNDKVFYFNHKKVFYLEKFYFENQVIINDENAFLKKNKNLGSFFLHKNKYLYWEKNPWNNSYIYQLDLKKLYLLQKFIIKKNLLGRLKSNFFNQSEYYVEEISYECRILHEWTEVESLFN